MSAGCHIHNHAKWSGRNFTGYPVFTKTTRAIHTLRTAYIRASSCEKMLYTSTALFRALRTIASRLLSDTFSVACTWSTKSVRSYLKVS
jgi:Holliday junction resolvasome RuvABC endonuclease subunit